MTFKNDLAKACDVAWERLHAPIAGLSAQELTLEGYREGWSIKDLLAHLGCWLAEAGREVAQMCGGTYERPELDVDEMNAGFYETWRERDLEAVRSLLASSHAHMLEQVQYLPEDCADQATERIRLHWLEHLEEHLPRLEEWVKELRAPS